MIEAAVAPARTVPAPGAARAARYLPWLEVASLVRVDVPAWGHREDAWLHWAAPVAAGRVVTESVRRIWPGARAAFAGEPPAAQRGDAGIEDEAALRAATLAVWRGWRPEVCRHRTLDAVSSIGEGRDDFRRRCLSGLGDAVRSGRLGHRDAPALAGVAGDIEVRVLDGGECRPLVLRGGVVWRPEGAEPRAALRDLMLGGGVRPPR